MTTLARYTLILAITAVPTLGYTQSGGMKGTDMPGMEMKGMDMGKKPAAGIVHKATGVVKKIDPKNGTVTLAHDPVKSLDWSAMTMSFQVKDKSMLDKLSTDMKVEFEFVQKGKNYVITSIK